MRQPKVTSTTATNNGVFIKRYFMHLDSGVMELGGYSYRVPAYEGFANGNPSRERCECCRASKHTTVNGVCIDCQSESRKDKRVRA